MTSINVAIVGAGPAGCTLARLLQLSNVPIKVTIFEREASLDARTQGGTLDLHTDTGIAALKKAKLYDEFLKFARFDGEAFLLCDKNLRRYISMSGTTQSNTRGRPEIDRADLRRLLLLSLAEDTVKWRSNLRSLEENDGKLTLHFEHGSETGFDLVVGAEGAWSKVRSLLSDVKPFHTGISGFRWSILDPKEKHAELYALVNRGSMFSFGDHKSVSVQQMGDGSLNCSQWSVTPEDWQEHVNYDIKDAEAVKTAMLEKVHDWAPGLRAAIEGLDKDHFDPWSLYMLPVDFKWEHKPGVTLIGDAAHLMSPFAGEGVNAAMKDSLDLSEAIVAAAESGDNTTMDGNIRKFERRMFSRNSKIAKTTYGMMSCMFLTPGAPNSTIEKYIYHAVASELNPVLAAGVMAIVYTYFFCFRLFGLGGGQKVAS